MSTNLGPEGMKWDKRLNWKWFQDVSRYSLVFNPWNLPRNSMDFKKKTWGFQLVFLPVPTSLCILPSSGDPRWKFLGIPNDGDMSWNDGTPQKIPMQNRNSFARKSNDGTPQVLISSFTTVSTILWQTPQKKKRVEFDPARTQQTTLTSQASHSRCILETKQVALHLALGKVDPGDIFGFLKSSQWREFHDFLFCGKAIDLHLNFFQTQFLSSSPVSAPRTQAAGLSAQCRTTTRHPPRRSTRGRRACASCEAGWLPEIYPSSGVIHICYVYVYMKRIDRWIWMWMWMWMRICICVFWNAGYMNSSKTFKKHRIMN